jgi:hypothetical protein
LPWHFAQLLTHWPKATPLDGEMPQSLQNCTQLGAGALQAVLPKPREANTAPIRPPTRRSASRRDIPPASAFANSSNRCSIVSSSPHKTRIAVSLA